jgi:nitronate monooxygenase
VVDSISPCPVIGAGGISDGRGLVAALALGAQAVWCGTAFLFATEANLSAEHRQQLLDADFRDVIVSTTYTGKPSRIVRTPLIDDWKASGLPSLPMPYQAVLMDDFVFAAQQAGRWDLANNPAGQAAGALNKIRPAAEIVASMVTEAEQVLNQMDAFLAT